MPFCYHALLCKLARIGSCNLFFGFWCWIQGDELRHLRPGRLFLRTERTNTRKVNQSGAFKSERKTNVAGAYIQKQCEWEREREREREKKKERKKEGKKERKKELKCWTHGLRRKKMYEHVGLCTNCTEMHPGKWSGWHWGWLRQKDFTCRGRSAESQHRGQPGMCWLNVTGSSMDPKPWNVLKRTCRTCR